MANKTAKYQEPFLQQTFNISAKFTLPFLEAHLPTRSDHPKSYSTPGDGSVLLFSPVEYTSTADASFVIDQLSNATALAKLLPSEGPDRSQPTTSPCWDTLRATPRRLRHHHCQL